MFLVILTYQKPLEVIDALLEAHFRYLEDTFARGVFLASGRQEPRTGGVILARAESRSILETILADDPFAREGAANYEIIEFIPGKVAPQLSALLD
ncbi:YciI family protein [Desulfovibrio sp. TomC]|uniref:YciI family protein n=1 Tax=Desulfovibrio sp. TomC TaxID=1562888 RepID=UPI0005733E3E|nr:YciI family protein [Desulfovibrio sp. TomC]KHK04394.1 hypothetical protein NY78_0172 [Desulfovibrio sp. TomC]